MFAPLLPVVTWIFTETLSLARFVWDNGSWLGVGLICLPLVSKVIHIFKKIF